MAAIAKLVQDVLVEGYLADPFLHSKADSFTDWYNPAYWAHNPGTYSIWRSIYPPFAFIFVRLLSDSRCYGYSIDSARSCDPMGIVVISVLTIVNFVLALLVYRKVDKATALPRAIAVGLGFPALYAWERGNLNVPCFTAYILAYGNLLKSTRLRSFLEATTLNFKPYLILVLAGHIVKRQWTRLEWSALWFVVIYAASFASFGAGDPLSIVKNTRGFEHIPDVDLISFATTYTAFLTILKLPLPLTSLLGSVPIETAESIIPMLIYAGAAGVLPCLAYSFFRPNICTREQVAAITLIFFMSLSTSAGGYALQFALFFVFFSRWNGVGQSFAIVATYLWCIPIDFPIFFIFRDYGYSFLGQRNVYYDLALTYGEVIRPGLLLLLEYGLIIVFAKVIIKDVLNLRNDRIKSSLL